MVFKGFSKDIYWFFSELKKNNNKEWFYENKSFYEKEIKEVSKQLVQEMSQRFASIGLPFIADPKVSLFRINRDIRFSLNKDPYKTNLGIYFPYISKMGERLPESPGLYYHFDPDESFIGGGIHMPTSQTLRSLRIKIASDWEELLDIINDKNFKREFPNEFFGEKLKRVPRGFDENHPAVELLKLKEFTVWVDINHNESYTKNLPDILERKAYVIAPFLEFLHQSIISN
ncbi:MAG: DUF2461 domain-containing protein [Candidatus Kapabacteria bacterium]|nr:DUF2461 domain-containing protein [Candidatus Kapabacteria bacterium]